MSRAAFIAFVMVMGVWPAFGRSEAELGKPTDVVVSRLPAAIPEDPAPEPGTIVDSRPSNEFIWDFCSKRPEIQAFNRYTTENWRKNAKLFSEALVEKAKENGFHSAALSGALSRIVELPIWKDYYGHEIAYLPIAAYYGKQGDTDICVVLCLWEYADPITEMEVLTEDPETGESRFVTEKVDPPKWQTIGHIRMFAYDTDTLEMLNFITCD